MLIPYGIVALWQWLASWDLAVAIAQAGAAAAAALALGFAVYYGFRSAGLRGALATLAVPAVFAAAVWYVARWIGLELPEPATWGPAIVALYFVGLLAILRKI